ncbi:GNAT family N-acetyltransferase [Salinarchaeum chitinilyticum]
MQIRPATVDDADAIARVHDRSVREIAADHYDDAVIDAWTSLTGDEGADDAEEDEDRQSANASEDAPEDAQPENGRLFVATIECESGDDGSPTEPVIAGFGDVRFDPPEYLKEPADGGVRAVYVHPDHAGEGIGTALLERLESTAREQGVESLGLQSSVNARTFYERHGYAVVESVTFQFGDEVEGPAVEMRKDL